MGIRCYCPKGHKLNVRSFQAGLMGVCPRCGAKFQVPMRSVRKSSKGQDAADAIEVAEADSPAESARESSAALAQWEVAAPQLELPLPMPLAPPRGDAMKKRRGSRHPSTPSNVTVIAVLTAAVVLLATVLIKIVIRRSL